MFLSVFNMKQGTVWSLQIKYQSTQFAQEVIKPVQMVTHAALGFGESGCVVHILQ
jgi:hypothetical protein